MYVISPSRINLYISCPRCFYLEVRMKIKRPVEYFPGIPALLDKIFKEITQELKEKDLPFYFKKYGIKGKLKSIKLQEKEIQNTNLILRGVPDEIIESEEKKLIALDYKTSSKFPENLPLPVQIQLDSYHLLFKLNSYEAEEKGYVFYFVPYYSKLEKRIRWRAKLYSHKINYRRLHKFIFEIDRLLREDEIPKQSKSCPYCNYVENVNKTSI
ncbi:MAG: PD-(D/E)XK nuclease family protein [Candidatus Hydrothermales bacterium]